ncbi:hypothetical protein PLICRDRAFT_86655 [Plicaturopsis crispa FD-325 SS-3]|nr:hypothetical protein PLICRDRAFT_86655 [Plicaturopsis crispa FD-325 SS-3]
MGKLTPDRFDNVLETKVKGLIMGSIERSKLEKTEPTMTYESFVEDLDCGDSFTTSIVDILVKELTDRRSRATTPDKRLISERTSKGLHMLAALRPYRARTARQNVPLPRRAVNLMEYLSAPPDQLEMDEDQDEFDRLAEATPPFEGARVDSELYDAYAAHPHHGTYWSHSANPSGRRSFSSYSAAVASSTGDPNTMDSVLPPLRSPPTHNPFSPPLPHSGGALLTRQGSLRRPARPRSNVDFNEFTSRRRSTIRQLYGEEHSGTRSDGTEDPSTLPTPARSPMPDESATLPVARRFFPFSRTRRHDSLARRERTETVDPEPDTLQADAVSRPWFLIPGPAPMSRSPIGDVLENESPEGPTSAPRLRRGGIRAPESMLSRHASPSVGITVNATSQPSSRLYVDFTPEPEETPMSAQAGGSSTGLEAHQLPTPSSETPPDHHENIAEAAVANGQ